MSWFISDSFDQSDEVIRRMSRCVLFCTYLLFWVVREQVKLKDHSSDPTSYALQPCTVLLFSALAVESVERERSLFISDSWAFFDTLSSETGNDEAILRTRTVRMKISSKVRISSFIILSLLSLSLLWLHPDSLTQNERMWSFRPTCSLQFCTVLLSVFPKCSEHLSWFISDSLSLIFSRAVEAMTK